MTDNIDEKPAPQWIETSSTDETQAAIVALAAEYVPGSDAEKRLLRKLDYRLIPCVWTLFLLNFIDRTNIGNAKTGGMATDLNLTSDQYSIVLLIFFAFYVVFEVPSNMILVRVRPSLYLPGICLIWGGIAAATAACNSWQALAGVRVALGIVESGFAPGATFWLSSWYRRYEISSRFAVYYTAISIAGGLSGLLAGVIYMDGARGIAGWRWLFIIEGAAGCLGALIITWFMPDYPSTSNFLTPEERLLAAQRLAYDGLANTQGSNERLTEWQALKSVAKDWRVWALSLLYALTTGAQTIQYFVPTIVVSLGWSSWTGQYHTIPFYACSAVCSLAYCFAADHWKNKSHFITLSGLVSCICYIITVTSSNQYVQYVFAILGFGNVYGACAMVLTWVPQVISTPAEKRAVAIAIVNSIGNSASIYGVFLWPSSQAPRYIPGFSATITFMAGVIVISQLLGYYTAKYPSETADPDSIIAAEIEKQRRQGTGLDESMKQRDV